MTAPSPRITVVTDDPALTRRVRRAVHGREPAADVVAVPALEEAADDERAHDVLVAGPPCRGRSALGMLAAFHELSPATSIVLAFDRPHVNVRHLIWTGADALVDPDDDHQVAVAVARSVELAAGRRGATLAQAPPALGQVYTVCSATGGCGKTFYATNLAAYLSRWTGEKVALVDLDLQFGEVTTALRLRVRHTIADALTPDDGADAVDLADLVPELLTRHDETGVEVLAAPRLPGEADRVTPKEVGKVLAALRASYDHVVVDTPTGLGESVLTALDVSEHLFLLAALDVPSLRNLRLFLQTLERLDIPDDAISLVLNKAERGLGVEVDEVERVFDRGFRSVLPYTAEVTRAVNRGLPVLTAAPEAEVSRQLAIGLTDLVPEPARPQITAAYGSAPSRSPVARLKRLFRSEAVPAVPNLDPVPEGGDA